MQIIERSTSVQRLVYVSPVERADFKHINAKRYLFNWKKFYDDNSIFKLSLIDNDDILGLIALRDYPQEDRIQIKLLAVSCGKYRQEQRLRADCGVPNRFCRYRGSPKIQEVSSIVFNPKNGIKATLYK